MAQLPVDYVRLKVFEEGVDQKHRLYRSVVLGETLCTLHRRTS
jgi:hypothetical protein